MNEHDWVIGLLTELEVYCHVNKFETVAGAVSDAISLAALEFDRGETSENILYISDYFARGKSIDRERIVSAYSGNLEKILRMD